MLDTDSPLARHPVQTLEHLPLSVRDKVLVLAECVEGSDGVYPLNEQALLDLDHGGRHLLVDEGDRLVGYASNRDSAAQILVDPSRRRLGIAKAILSALQQEDGDTELWAFGDLPPARSFCVNQGFHPVRGILVMERSGGGDLRTESQVTISRYEPQDMVDIQRVNSRAFKAHPEQGGMTLEDFRVRMEAPWFDPQGLLVARNETGEVVGFHWTKIEQDYGEVYVLAVDPDAAGAGVGGALLEAGLAYLESRGVARVRLWVDAHNDRAIVLYHRFGFTAIRRDVRYRRVGADRRITGSVG